MHYYKRNIGDYHKKAGRLSMLEHGAYTLLIDACYDREQFPTLQDAIDWTWSRTEEEIAAVKFVLSKFFTLIDGKYVQNHIQEDLIAYQDACDTNARIAKEREEKRRKGKRGVNENGGNDNEAPRSVHEASRDEHEAPPNHKPLTINQEPNNILIDPAESIDIPPSKKSERKPKNTAADFERFYTAYPRKVSKTNAQKAFAKIDLTKHPLETMLTALERYKLTAQWQDKNLIPHPATWLSRQQWLDELDERDMQHNGTMPAGQYVHDQQAGEPETYSAMSAQPGNYNPDMYKPAKPFVPEVSTLTPEEQAKAQRRIYELAEQLKGGRG